MKGHTRTRSSAPDWAAASVRLPEHTRPFSVFSRPSLALRVEVAFGLSLGWSQRLAGSLGSPPSSSGVG